MASSYGIHWFRRDLRITGNPGLIKNWKRNEGRVVGLFSFDRTFLDRSDFSPNRFQFFLKTLRALQENMQARGGDLLVLNQSPEDAFLYLLKNLSDRPQLITWNRDYEPFARGRDTRIANLLRQWQVNFETERDHLLIEPHELGKDAQADAGYQVYSPFARKWRKIFETPEIQERIQALKSAKPLKFELDWNQVFGQRSRPKDFLSDFIKENIQKVSIEIPEAGEKAAMKQLKTFKKKMDHYREARDYPAVQGTSRLSVFLKNGSLTVPQIIAHLDLKTYGKAPLSSREIYFSELIWREFYYHVLYRHPQVETESFLKKYSKIKWSRNKRHFKAWCDGVTGFPIVDAGMRELKTTGFMHNRVRMIVASFLTKDLHIHWQWGEKHFMNLLLDGDLASNNGGWQWASSTGTDPQPYFRIFNPWSQSERFDPKGEYIKKFVPELQGLPAQDLHRPILNHKSYPKPIVDHSTQSKAAIAMYKGLK